MHQYKQSVNVNPCISANVLVETESSSLYWTVWIDGVAVPGIQCARKVSLKRVKKPPDGDGDIVKDGCQLCQ